MAPPLPGGVMPRCLTATLAAALTLAPCGCGTVWNLTSQDTWKGSEPPAGKVYGGVALDAREAKECFVGTNHEDLQALVYRPFWYATGLYLAAVDLPLSAVADTLTLPMTVPSAFRQASTSDAPPRPEQQDP